MREKQVRFFDKIVKAERFVFSRLILRSSQEDGSPFDILN